MTAGRGKGASAKGSRFESKLAKEFSSWWATEYSEERGVFYRTPRSGALRWQSRSDTIGDLTTPEGFTCVVEAKNREDWKHSDFFGSFVAKEKSDNLPGWWNQARDESRRANKIPLLIISKAYAEDLIVFPSSSLFYITCKEEFSDYVLTRKAYYIVDKVLVGEEIVITPLKKFFSLVNPSLCREKR